jgi:hypothetical protein
VWWAAYISEKMLALIGEHYKLRVERVEIANLNPLQSTSA